MSNHVLLEIGIEELPARFIDNAEEQLLNKTKRWLEDMHITFGQVSSFSTPRRLAVIIEEIAAEQTTITEVVRGPQTKIAKDEAGEWTKAAIGFAKGQGKTPNDIYIEEVKGLEYIFVEKVTEGKKTEDVLPGLKDIVTSIHFPQTMRWGNESFRYARPIRWLVALYNETIIPFDIAHVSTGNKTYGHRFLGNEVEITNPLSYEEMLENNYVIADPKKREKLILEQIQSIEEETDFHIQVEPKLLNEVRNLIEYPTAFYGTFNEEYLHLPEETLITSMAEHQRYFPVMTKDQTKLLPYFVSVRNGDDKQIENVARGNEKVLRARLADGAFFYAEDKSNSIDFYNNKLKTVVFQEKIGTTYEKVQNVVALIEKMNAYLDVQSDIATKAKRTAEICKFDLMTSMVGEFPELQGIMGEKYALHFGEDNEVAQGIREHYYPTSSNGELPDSTVGALVSVADKLDTIVSCISVGLIPTGSQDPLGLRRQAIGLLRILQEQKWDISVEKLISFTYDLYHVDDASRHEIQTFFANRVTFIFQEYGIEQDVIHAVIDDAIGVLGYSLDKAKLLSDKRDDPSFKSVEESLVRVMNLSDKADEKQTIDEALFETASEKQLYDDLLTIETAFDLQQDKYDANAALNELAKLEMPIHQFFEYNMVMADDESIKQNRLALVLRIAKLIEQYANMTLIEWKQHH